MDAQRLEAITASFVSEHRLPGAAVGIVRDGGLAWSHGYGYADRDRGSVPDPQTLVEMIGGMAALRRAPRLADVAEVAAFLASDRAAGMTGTMANVTSGLTIR